MDQILSRIEHCPTCYAGGTDSFMDLITISAAVASALAANKPVVALESTVIAHGLPRPQNLQTAQRLEEIVREAGGTPATIALLDGEACAGLNEDQVRVFANQDDIKKKSKHDTAVAGGRQKQSG